MPTARRTPLGSVTRSWPPTIAVPLVGASVVVRMEMVVVFPAPFGPSSAKSSPSRTLKLMLSTAFSSAPL